MKAASFIFVSVFLISFLGADGVRNDSRVAVETLAGDCSQGSDGAIVLFDSTHKSLNGWSHVVSSPDRFPLTHFENGKYAVDSSSIVADPDCPDSTLFRSILTRKIGNWGQQHANGIEPRFFEHPLAVNEIESVSLWIRLNSEDSSIPSREELAESFGSLLTQEQIDALDRGNACFGFTLLEYGYNNQSLETLNASILVEFDPASDFDQWIKVTIPMQSFGYSFEKNYANRSVEMNTVMNRELVAFRINPETSGGIVSRNFISENWNDSNPELYKEMSLSIRRIEINLK